MNNKILAFVIAVSMVAVPAISMAQTSSDDADSSSAIPSAGSTDSSASIGAPSTGDTTSSAGSDAPSVGPTTSSAGTDSTLSSPPATPAVPSSGGGSSSGSFVGGGFSPIIVASSATTSCPLLTSYLQLGANNDGTQVTKLQAFLKDSQHMDVDVNGVFDQKTQDAVKAFQVKYLSDTMGPWGATQGSGIVYITTEKKINALACNSPLTLSQNELATIEAYKNASANNQNNATVGSTAPGNLNASTTILGPIGVSGNGSGNTASVINASVLQRFWNFIKNIF